MVQIEVAKSQGRIQREITSASWNMLPEDSDVRKFQVIYPAKDFFFPNYLFCVILQGEHVLSIYVQNVISAFYLFVHEQVINTNVLTLY